MKLENAQKQGKEIFCLCIEAARRRVTLGEMSDAMEESFGRYKANIKTISGVYAMNASKNEFLKKQFPLLKNLKTKKDEDQELWLPKWDKTVTIEVRKW
jgi:methylmalonyl-CoA mutase